MRFILTNICLMCQYLVLSLLLILLVITFYLWMDTGMVSSLGHLNKVTVNSVAQVFCEHVSFISS